MLIGNQYADNKLYRGIKHYDHMPLTSEDIHEYSDTVSMKNAYLMNNLLGYGTLNTPTIVTDSSGLELSEPSVVMIDGDIALVQSDNDVPLVTRQQITDAGHQRGVVGIIGWYQAITSGSTMRNYGGVDNSILLNDLSKAEFKSMQISSRFQFRWFPVIVSKEDASSDTLSIEIADRDVKGDRLDTVSTIESKAKINNSFVFEAPVNMYYAISDLYFVPILEYHEENDDIVAIAFEKMSAGSPFIVSHTKPEGISTDGTTWYNPDTREFQTYVGASGGFVSSASKMAFLQYQSIHVIDEEIITPQDVVVPVDINQLLEGDIVRVIYEGLELANELHYTINYADRTVTLKDFTTNVGDTIYFTVTRVVEASDITNITTSFLEHIDTTATNTKEGHVRLTDSVLSTSGVTQGVAATPKLLNTVKKGLEEKITANSNDVKDIKEEIDKLHTEVSGSNLIVDSSTSKKYKFGIDSGILYLEEV